MKNKKTKLNEFSCKYIWLIVVIMGVFAVSISAEENVKKTMNPPRVKFTSQNNGVDKSILNLSFELDEGWHINALEPADEFLVPLGITLKCSGQCSGIESSKIVFPKPDTLYVEELELSTPIYQGKINFEIPIDSKVESLFSVNAIISYQACTHGFCLPPTTINVGYSAKGRGEASATLGKKENDVVAKVHNIESESAAAIGLFQAILFAFLGGLLLNLMPCVLPVLSLKVLSLVQQAKASKKQRTKYAGAFSAGVIVSFWLLAAVILGLKNAGESVGWGFQFQDPTFVAGLCLVVFLFALNLFGLFEITLNYRVQTKAAEVEGKEGYLGSFSKGALMTLLSTPCSAPFLAPAMGWAFAQSGVILFVSFSAAAVGLALPYFLLTRYPGFLRWIPKPGPWMNTLKQFMGFLLLVTALWTLSILSSFGGLMIIERFAVILLLLAMFIWVFGKIQFKVQGVVNLIAVVLMIAFAVFAVSWGVSAIAEQEMIAQQEMVKESKDGGQAYFDKEGLMAEVRGGQAVLLDFTADWCLSCKTLEKTVLHSDEIELALKENNVKLKVADWTKKDPVITSMLQEFGRSGVPIYVLYPAGKPNSPILLPDWISIDDVLKGIKKASELSKRD